MDENNIGNPYCEIIITAIKLVIFINFPFSVLRAWKSDNFCYMKVQERDNFIRNLEQYTVKNTVIIN